MAENEFVARGEDNKEPEVPRKKKSKKAPRSQSYPLLERLSERIDAKKVKTTMGVILLLTAVYLFLACFSYLFTWQADQNRVMDKGLFEFLMEDNDLPLENWLGKFGAWTSHLLIYRWFGLASFTFPLVFLVLGFKYLFNITLLPISKTIAACALFTVWFSGFFGYFASKINYLGGTFGYQLNDWLTLAIGRFGTLILIIATGYVFMLITLNEQVARLLQRFGWLRKKEGQTEDEGDLDPVDMTVGNILDPRLTKEDLIARTVHFTEDEEDNVLEEEEDEDDLHSEIVDDLDDDGIEFLIPEAEETSGDFSIEIAKEKEEDKTLDEEDVDRMRREYGEYDPKLDLASYALPPLDLLKDYGGQGGKVDKAELEENKNKIVQTLLHYKIEIAKIRATVGPTV